MEKSRNNLREDISLDSLRSKSGLIYPSGVVQRVSYWVQIACGLRDGEGCVEEDANKP